MLRDTSKGLVELSLFSLLKSSLLQGPDVLNRNWHELCRLIDALGFYLIERRLELLGLFLQLWPFHTHYLRQKLILEAFLRGNEIDQRALNGRGCNTEELHRDVRRIYLSEIGVWSVDIYYLHGLPSVEFGRMAATWNHPDNVTIWG